VLEVLMNGLRLRHGIDQRYLPSHPALPAFRQQMIQRGLLADQPGRWVCTTTGYRFLDSLLESLSGILD
jgi:coproporphyrinogen III oxidase-like Fe-S oxidoreductase